MKIYLAGEGHDKTNIWNSRIKRRLYSFYYHGFSRGAKHRSNASGLTDEMQTSVELEHEIFLDSGAFTAYTKEIEISVEEYGCFVKKHPIWTACSSLDAIGRGIEAARRSYLNFKQLCDLGVKVQPVFHVREPDSVLQYYVDQGWDYIFIGGMVPETTRWLRLRLDGLWDSILTNEDGTAKVKIHGFGLTDSQLMFRYPWYSVDSSSWLMFGSFGACIFRTIENKLRKVVFSDESPEARKMPGWHYKNLAAKQRDVVDEWLAPYGVTAEQVSFHYRYRHLVNAAVFQGLEDLGTDRFHLSQIPLFQVAAE